MADLTDTDWLQPLTERLGQSYFDAVQQFLQTVYASGAVYPARENVFAAYRATPLSQVKVVLGTCRHGITKVTCEYLQRICHRFESASTTDG